MKVGRLFLTMAALTGALAAGSSAFARDAAFLDPGAMAGPGDEAVHVEPKADIDAGETTLGVTRRTTIFFVNETGGVILVQKIAINADGDVNSQISNDDCSKQGTIAPQSKCSVEISVTPTSPGPWSVEVLMTHNGAGRIARAKISGKTTGSSEKKETGLAVSSKESTPVNFGDVDVGAKAARSALMVNDSAESITIYSIDVIEADNGLTRLDQGCAVDMELKPGESCPVTLVWMPKEGGQISTDLIIRHSGRLGFAVIPIRGNAKGETPAPKDNAKTSAAKETTPPPPPTAAELEKATAGKLPPVSESALAKAETPTGPLRLIGTVGLRAVLLLPDGNTKVAGVGDDVDLGGDKTAHILSVDARSAEVMIDGKKKKLDLEAAPELTSRAAADAAAAAEKGNKNSSGKSTTVSGAAPRAPTGGAVPIPGGAPMASTMPVRGSGP